MSKVALGNARNPEQLRAMRKLAATGQCHFCREGFEKRHRHPIVHESKHWFVTKNTWPYRGSVHQYLLIVKRHVTKASELLPEEGADLFQTVFWLEQKLKVPGYSLFVRSGNMNYTGATLDHLHIQFIVGKKKNKKSKRLLVTLGYKKVKK